MLDRIPSVDMREPFDALKKQYNETGSRLGDLRDTMLPCWVDWAAHGHFHLSLVKAEDEKTTVGVNITYKAENKTGAVENELEPLELQRLHGDGQRRHLHSQEPLPALLPPPGDQSPEERQRHYKQYRGCPLQDPEGERRHW